jgi:hypothetical protein
MWQKKVQFFFQNLKIFFFQKMRILWQYPCFICTFHIFANFHTPIKNSGLHCFSQNWDLINSSLKEFSLLQSFCLLMNSIHWSQSQLYKLHPIPLQLLWTILSCTDHALHSDKVPLTCAMGSDEMHYKVNLLKVCRLY